MCYTEEISLQLHKTSGMLIFILIYTKVILETPSIIKLLITIYGVISVYYMNKEHVFY